MYNIKQLVWENTWLGDVSHYRATILGTGWYYFDVSPRSKVTTVYFSGGGELISVGESMSVLVCQKLAQDHWNNYMEKGLEKI